MTVRTRRALNRVRNHARSLVKAVDALESQDWQELSWWFRSVTLPDLLSSAKVVECRLASRLDDDGLARKAPVRITGSDGPGGYGSIKNAPAPTLAEIGDYRRDDQADEARDVAREMAAREEA